jgi:hypothetical protein
VIGADHLATGPRGQCNPHPLTLNEELPVVAPPDEEAIAARARKRSGRRRLAVWTARRALFVFIVGGWQLFTHLKIVDPFFFGQPSGIVKQLRDWIANGTQYGSLEAGGS